MSEKSLQYHPSNPSNQAFNVKPHFNKTKKHSWWHASSSTYWRNRGKDTKRQRKGDAE